MTKERTLLAIALILAAIAACLLVCAAPRISATIVREAASSPALAPEERHAGISDATERIRIASVEDDMGYPVWYTSKEDPANPAHLIYAFTRTDGTVLEIEGTTDPNDLSLPYIAVFFEPAADPPVAYIDIRPRFGAQGAGRGATVIEAHIPIFSGGGGGGA